VTYFGLTTADNFLLLPDDTDAQGHPVYTRPSGFGFFIVIEAKKGLSGALPVFPNPSGSDAPDLQIEANQDLGNGSPVVCDVGPTPAPGGVPGINPPNFDPSSPDIVAALNDFSCRFFDNTNFPCTNVDDSGIPKKVMSDSDKQYCTQRVLGQEMAFHSGYTLLTVQLSDAANNIGDPVSIVIYVP
jgi:hypothetical protein